MSSRPARDFFVLDPVRTFESYKESSVPDRPDSWFAPTGGRSESPRPILKDACLLVQRRDNDESGQTSQARMREIDDSLVGNCRIAGPFVRLDFGLDSQLALDRKSTRLNSSH